MINRNLRNGKLYYENVYLEADLDSDEIDSENAIKKTRINILKSIEVTLHKILVPISFSLIVSTVTYCLIGSTILFDSLRIFCLFSSNFKLKSIF